MSVIEWMLFDPFSKPCGRVALTVKEPIRAVRIRKDA